jgi:CBS domain containing-hemolysin-like protein
MIEGVLDVADLHVRDIMVPRSQMTVLERDAPPDDLLPVVVESGHSRFPVIGEDRDQVVGILLAKDLLRYFADGGQQAPDPRRQGTLLPGTLLHRAHRATLRPALRGAGLRQFAPTLEQRGRHRFYRALARLRHGH